MTKIVSCLIWTLAFSGLVTGQVVRDDAKERFQIGYRLTFAEASSDHDFVLQQLKLRNEDERTKLCDSEWFRHARSNNTEWGKCYLSPPFPLLSSLPTDADLQPWLGWAPLHEAAGGLEAVRSWKEQAESGTVFNCNGPICERIVELLVPVEEDFALARCNIADLKGGIGAPWNCQPVLIASKEGVLVRVATAYTQVHRRGKGMPDFSIKIIGRTLPGVAAIARATGRALTGDPLMLSTETIHGTSWVGTRSYQASRVLQDFRPRLREMATVRVDMYGDQLSNLSSIELVVSTTLYVNSMNTTRPEDWTLPDQAKEQAYVRAVRDSLKKSVEGTCTNRIWRSDRVLTCGLPPDAPLPSWAWQ